MGDITRNLYPYAIGRNTVETVTLVTLTQVFNNRGTYTNTPVAEEKKARVVALTQAEIIRLAEGGITANQGVSISLAEEVTKVPDRIKRANGVFYKIVVHSVQEGCSVFIADVAPLAPNKGYEDPTP